MISLVEPVGGSDQEDCVDIAMNTIDLLQELRGELLADRVRISPTDQTNRIGMTFRPVTSASDCTAN